MNTYTYTVYSNNVEYYLKVVELISDFSTSYTFSFGSTDSYCFVATMNNATTPYIDRIEYNQACVRNGEMITTDLVKTALWTMKLLIPRITHFTLIDDAHIDCVKGSKLNKLNIAYDSIIKRNKTWYEHNFHAMLPSTEMYNHYKTSLRVLDAPIQPYEYVLNSVPSIRAYKEIYAASSTPRDFINKLRDTLGDDYCKEVGKWLSGYMESLGVATHKTEWVIPAFTIKQPAGYNIFTSPPTKGGRHRRTSRHLDEPYEGRQMVGYWGDPAFD